MKHIYKVLVSVFVIFNAVACYNQEIENPQNSDQQQSEFRITASIIQTRVSYNDMDEGYLGLQWQTGDMLYGFIEGETPITFEVSRENAGVATLVAASGSEDALSSLEGGETVDLVYIGNQTPSYDEDGNIIVSMNGQDPSGKIPACMSARDVVENTDGSKSLDFHFVNDCAIFEIESLTGETSGKALDCIKIPYLFSQGQYTLSDEGFIFTGVADSLDEDYEIDVDQTKWAITNGGVVTYNGVEQPLLIAVVPIGSDEAYSVELEDEDGEEYTYTPNITVNAMFSDASNSVFTYGKSTIQGGICYVISADPVVAKIDFGGGTGTVYYSTVAEAFAAVESAAGDDGYPADGLTVVLIKDHIDGFGEQTASQTHMSSIDIKSHVTLDLNGCTLSLSGVEGFNVNYIDVNTPATFTITDRNGLNDDAEYEGKIKSTSSNPIIINNGNVKIDGGEFYYTFSDDIDNDRFCMIHNDGGTITINNHSFLQAEGDSEVNIFLIKNDFGGTVNINNGDLYSYDAVNTIYNLKGTVTMSDGELFSEKKDAILNEADGIVNIVDGDIDSGGYYSIENRGKVTISGGNIYKYEDNDQVPTNDHATIYNTNQLIVKGGIISSSLNYAVYCEGGSIEMSDGEISCSHLYSGALVLNDAVNSSISGGTLTCSGKSTISITGTSTLDVSGGKIISIGQNAAIEIDARDTEKIKKPTLTVRWSGNDVKDQSPGVYEPFLYSPKYAPIYEKSSFTDHFSTVYIKGGFLYTGTSVRYFYKSDNGNTALQATSGYYFYSNVSSLHSNALGVKASSTSLSSAITIDASTHGVPGVTTGLSFSNKISIVVK